MKPFRCNVRTGTVSFAMVEGARILVVDDEESLRHMLGLTLSKDGYQVWTAGSGPEALAILSDNDAFDVCITDVRMPGMDGLTFVERARHLPHPPTLVAMSAYGDEALALEALRRGAFDYLSKPFEPADLSLKLKLLVERRRLASKEADNGPYNLRPQKQPQGLEHIVGIAPSMLRVFDMVRRVASFPSTVLLTGETGTGKERIAGALHQEGHRASRPFVAVNCSAIPENLLESELFGHVRGAFTDAHQTKTGLFALAHRGTLFLDEIAELPVSLQVKLLRVLVDQEVRPVGGTETKSVDVRVIAATSRDLKARVAEGLFREDLLYRLAVVSIHLPPLRERREDIRALVEHVVQRIAHRLGLPCPEVTEEAMKVLSNYDWPGNVRELENALERALVLSDGQGRLTVVDLDDRFETRAIPETALLNWIHGLEHLSVKEVMPKVERSLIEVALERTAGNRTQASTLLGMSQRALLYKLKDYGIK